MLNINIQMKDLDQTMAQINAYPKQIEKALYSAMKKTLNSARTVVGRQIKEHSTLSATKVSKSISKPFIKLDSHEITGKINVNTVEPISLIKYRILPNKNITARKGAARSRWQSPKAQYKKSGSIHAFDNGSIFSKPFIAIGKSKNKHVFRRNIETSEWEKQVGPRLQYFMQIENLQDAVINSAKDNFLRYLRHEIEYRSKKLS